ncbi:hypothetical protein QT13_01685 [Pectobacterium brasiliense]|uniref:hypothetical protein n=1 Tax=Pectobacterium brasiliense TaxID=180957 RepID=UPI00058051A4|nr:hypothetical protein [Pectobacterium brasiliense]KHS76979.1 hypothetical protein QT13_01685 [Pectobacterium brasiliense]
MTADEWLNECLLIDGDKQIKRKDAMELSIPRQDFVRAIFIGIQRSVEMKIPDVKEDETVQHYRARVINAAMKSGATVITDVG